MAGDGWLDGPTMATDASRSGLEAAPQCHQAKAGDVHKLGKARLSLEERWRYLWVSDGWPLKV